MRTFTIACIAFMSSSSGQQLDNVFTIDTIKVKGHHCEDNTIECQAVKRRKNESLTSKESLKSFMADVDQCLYSAGIDCTAKISFEVLFGPSSCVSSRGLQLDLTDFKGWMIHKDIELYEISASNKKCEMKAQFGPASTSCGVNTPNAANHIYDVKIKSSDKFRLNPDSEYDIVDALNIWMPDTYCSLTYSNDHKIMTTIFHDAYTPQGIQSVTTPATGQQTTIATTSAPTNAVADINIGDPINGDFTIQVAAMYASGNCVMTSGACQEFVKQHWSTVTIDQFKSIADLQVQCQNSGSTCSTGLRGHVQFARDRLCYPQRNPNHFGLDTRLFKGFKLGDSLTLGVSDYASTCAKLYVNSGTSTNGNTLTCPADFAAAHGPGNGVLVRQNLPNFRLLGNQDVYLSDYLQISPIEASCQLSINPNGQFGFDFLRVMHP